MRQPQIPDAEMQKIDEEVSALIAKHCQPKFAQYANTVIRMPYKGELREQAPRWRSWFNLVATNGSWLWRGPSVNCTEGPFQGGLEGEDVLALIGNDAFIRGYSLCCGEDQHMLMTPAIRRYIALVQQHYKDPACN